MMNEQAGGSASRRVSEVSVVMPVHDDQETLPAAVADAAAALEEVAADWELVLAARRLGLAWCEHPVAVRSAATRGRRRAPGLMTGARELWRLRRVR